MSSSLGGLPCVAQVWISPAEPLELFCLAHGLFLIRRGPENQSDFSHLRRVPSPVPRGPSGKTVPRCFPSRTGCPASPRHTFLLTHTTYLMLSEFPNQRKKMTSSPSQEICSLPRKAKSGGQGTQPRCSSKGWRNFRGQIRGLQPVLRGEEKFGKHCPPPKVSSFDAFYFNFQVSSEFFLWETHTSTPSTYHACSTDQWVPCLPP